MPIIYEGGSTEQKNTQTDYTDQSPHGHPHPPAQQHVTPPDSQTTPHGAFDPYGTKHTTTGGAASVSGAPKQPPPDPQTIETKQQEAINGYIYSRAQRYLVGSAFTSAYEKAPSYPDLDALTHGQATWWIQHPAMFGNTISSNTTEEQHRKLVKHVPGVYDWVGQHDHVAGVPGVLTGMRLAALHIVNPEVRTWAINYIDSIKHLKAGDQQAVLSYMMDITGSTDAHDLVHEALKTRRAYVNAYLAQPEVQAQQKQNAIIGHQIVQGERSTGGGLTGKAALDFASEQNKKAIAAWEAAGMPADGPLADAFHYWEGQVNQANLEYMQQQKDEGVQFSQDNGFIGSEVQLAKDVAGLAGSGLEQQYFGRAGSQALNQQFQAHLAPHIANWWRDGNNLPFTVHWNPGSDPFVNQLLHPQSSNGGSFLDTVKQAVGQTVGATPQQQTFQQVQQEQTQQYTLHHLSAQSEVEAGAVVATIVFAPGLIEFLGNQALNLAKIQAFMKILHGVNLVTQQAGQRAQGVQVSGVPGDILNPVFHVGGMAVGGVAAALHAGTAAADNVMLDVQNKLASGTATVAGNFGWQMTGTEASIAAQIEMAMLMESMGRVGSDIKVNLGMTADAAAGQIGVGNSLAETYRLNDSSLMHPYRAVMDPIIDYAVTNMMQYLHATDLPSVIERWNDSGFLGKKGMFDIIGGWQGGSEKGPTDWRTVAGKIRERYPMLPEGYAEVLAKTPRDQMLAASMDYIKDWGIHDFKSTTGQLSSVKAKLSKMSTLVPDIAGTKVTYKGEKNYPEDGFPQPMLPDGTPAFDRAVPVPSDPAQYDDFFKSGGQGDVLLNQGWQHTEMTLWTGEESDVLVPPDTVFPGDAGYSDLNPPTYTPHPLEGQPKPVFSGHGYGFPEFDPTKFNPRALHGPGIYSTEDYTVAGGEPSAENIRGAQASGGDIGNTDISIGYAGKYHAPSYDYHEIALPEEMRGASMADIQEHVKREAIIQRKMSLIHMGEDPKNYDIETVLTPTHKGYSGDGLNVERWSVATKAIKHGLPEVAPNVHYGYMDIKSPLNLDESFSLDEAQSLLEKSGLDHSTAAAEIRQTRKEVAGRMSGEEIRAAIQSYFGHSGETGYQDYVDAIHRAGFDGFTHMGGDIMGGGHRHQVWIALDPAQYHRGVTPALLDDYNNLLAQKAALEDKLTTLQKTPNEVITNLPTSSMPDFLHRVMYRPVGVTEGTFHTILNFGRYTKKFLNWSERTISGDATKGFFNENSQSLVAKLVDKLDSKPQLRFASPDMPRAERQIIEDNNAQILDRVLQRVGFSPEDAALLKGRLAAAKTQDEWFTVLSQDFLGEKGQGLHLMSKYLPDTTPQWLRDRILSMNEGVGAPKYYQRSAATGRHGQSELNNLLDGELVLGDRRPLPAAPSMFKNSYNVPISDISTALGGVSRLRAAVGDVKIADSIKKHDTGALFTNIAAQVYDWGKAGLALTTSVGKPLAMIANIPAIIATKMLDETMGNAMDPRILRQFKTRADALDYFSRVDPRILGKVVANGSSWVGLDGHDVTTRDVTHTAADLYQHGMDPATADSVAQRIVDMSTDPLISRIAQENDPERVLAILYGEEHSGINPEDPSLIHFYRGSGVIANDSTKYWWKGLFGRDTISSSHDEAIATAQSYDKNGGYQHFVLDPNARILVQGTPEFDALVGTGSEFHSQASQEYQPGSILPGSGMDQAAQLDELYRRAKDAGYQAIHMNEQDALGTSVLDPSILRDPYATAQPVMADERLQRFFDTQLRPQIERSLEAHGVPVTEETVRARTRQLIADWQDVIHQSTWNHPDLLEFVQHGRLGGRGIDTKAAASMSPDLAHEYQSLQEEVTNLREHISKLDGKDNPVALQAAQTHLHDKLAEIDHIENQVLGTGDQTDQLLGAGNVADQIRQDTKQALARRVQDLWGKNELTPPDKFTVREDLARLQSSSTTDIARGNARRLQEFMYRNGQFKFIGKAEAATAKGSFFAQRADAIARGYIRSGMKPDEAMALAEWKALDETRDFNYDITAKSTAERSIRNLMWFAPVQGELMYRWMYAIPATMGGWLPGAALMTGRLVNWYHLLKTSGLVHKNPVSGEDVITVPGLGGLIQHLATDAHAHVKLPDTLDIPLLSINPHLFGVIKDPLPSLSPGPSFLLQAAAHATNAPLLQDLSTLAGPVATNQFIPSGINSILGMYGINVGSHFLGTSYQRLQWDRAHDVGLQYAYADLQKQGITAPSLAQFGLDSAAKNYIVPSAKTADKIDQASRAYQVAWAGWFGKLNDLAGQYANGSYALGAISSTLIPGYIQESSTDQQAYQQFFQDNILPKIHAGADQGVIGDSINKWLSTHPNSQAFAVSYNYYTGQTWQVPFQQTDPQYAKQLYAQGIKAPMDPTDYANFLSGKAMIEGYRAQLNSAISAAAPDGKWQTLLRNWYKRGTAVQSYSQELDMFNRLNPDALAAYNKVAGAAQAVNGAYPHQGIVYEYVAQAMNDLRILAPGMLGGDVQGDYSTVLSRLGQAKAQLYQDYPGAANDPMTKGINWYFDHVITPYYKTMNPLFDQAKALTAQGASKAQISDLYHQVDVQRRKFDNPGHGAPSPEEFAYATLSPYDQKLAVIKWATQPVSWLSQFQYDKVYGDGNYSKGVGKLFDEQYKFNKEDFLPLMNTTSSNSKYGQSLQAWADQQYQNMAEYYSHHGVPDAVQIMNLENGTPFERLKVMGFGTDNKGMKSVYDMAKTANDAITAAGNSPAGFSQTAVLWKTWFYNNLNAYLALPDKRQDGSTNQTVVQFKKYIDMLSQSQKTVGTTGLQPSGLALYEEIFFGNFSLDKYPAPNSITNLFK